jgi:hypothetical protein
MKRSRVRGIAIILVLMCELSRGAAAAEKSARAVQLVGTWSLVLVDNVLPDGSRVHLYGPNPQGILMFDAEGRYSLQLYRSGRAKFASDDKSKGTPEEYSAAVQGANSHFGRYALNEADGAVTFIIEHASYPNWEGTQQKRSLITLSGDRLKYVVPTPTTGGTAIGELEWQRAP